MVDRRRPTFLVGIGGSAGGLTAYKALFDSLRDDTGMAFVVVAHLYPTANSQLAEILSRHTQMLVSVATDAMPIRPNNVYVIPSNADLQIKNAAFKVTIPRTKSNVQIDLFFTSMADAMGTRSIGVIASGYDGDGTAGCKHIKAKGGRTYAQDMSAEINLMSRHAVAAGFVDFVLPPHEIAQELQKLAEAFK